MLNVFPGSIYNVYAQPNTAPAPTLVGTMTADAEGVAPGAFALTAPFGTTTVTLSVYLTPGGGAPPAPAAATFVSPLAGTLACTLAGQVLPVAAVTPRLLAKVVQEQTGCPAGAPANWSEVVDVIVANLVPAAVYDVYIQANNGTGGFVKAGSVTTNGQGNGGGILTVGVGTTGGAPTGVTVDVVPAGGAARSGGGAEFRGDSDGECDDVIAVHGVVRGGDHVAERERTEAPAHRRPLDATEGLCNTGLLSRSYANVSSSCGPWFRLSEPGAVFVSCSLAYCCPCPSWPLTISSDSPHHISLSSDVLLYEKYDLRCIYLH